MPACGAVLDGSGRGAYIDALHRPSGWLRAVFVLVAEPEPRERLCRGAVPRRSRLLRALRRHVRHV